MIKKIAFLCGLLPFMVSAADNRIDFLNFSTQTEFKTFSEDLTGALAPKTLMPAEPLGLTGFDIGLSYTQSNLKNKQMNQVSVSPKDTLDLVGVHIAKGLPLGIDIGLDYALVPGSNISTLGGSLSVALLDGSTLYPAVTIGGNYNQTQGVNALDFQSYSAELAISKGFANITPYASIGSVMGEVTPDNSYNLNTTLKSESTSMVTYSAGVNINLFIMDILVGYNQIGEVSNYSLKAGYRF